MLIQSLYLVMCYITFDFFGALASPFFSWLRTGAAIAHFAYLPLFVGALLAIDLGLAHLKKEDTSRLIAGLLGAQVLAGLLLFLCHGAKEYFVWPLLFGPREHIPGTVETQVYWESLACLIPLGWICTVHIVGTLSRQPREPIVSRTSLSPFVIAGVGTCLLYQVAARMRMSGTGEAFSFANLTFSLAAQLSLFIAAFLVSNGIRVCASLLPNPRVGQFILHCIGAWLAIALVLRKIVFGLLAFSSRLADWYAMAFALAVVLFVGSIILEIRSRRWKNAAASLPNARRSWTVPLMTVLAALGCFVCSEQVAAFDWAHELGSLAFIIMWVLLLRCCVLPFRRDARAGLALLTLLAVVDLGGLAGIRTSLQRPNVTTLIEQSCVSDPSLFVIYTLFKPALRDEKYAAWYAFLTDHASIRNPIPAPTVPLTANLQATKGYKPNIFIFVIDALRQDYVSAYNPGVTFTPHMQEFAKDSVVFRNAYSFYAGTALADPEIFSGFQQISKTFPYPLTQENNLQPMLDVDNYDCYVSFNSIVRSLYARFPQVTRLKVDQSDQLDFGPIANELQEDIATRKDRSRPIFVFAQPTNVHTLFLAWHGGKAEVTPHPGFNDKYASAVERVDRTFGNFLAFLKQQGLYDDSIIMISADHGESLGEMGRTSHVANITPEVIRVPLMIHLPQSLRSAMVWSADDVVTLRDITPTLYYLLGHRPLKTDPMIGRPLFTLTAAEQKREPVDHYLLMSSYQAVFGILSADQKKLFMTDAVLHRNSFFDLSADPLAFKNRVTADIVKQYQPVLRQDLENIDKFYNVSEQQLSH